MGLQMTMTPDVTTVLTMTGAGTKMTRRRARQPDSKTGQLHRPGIRPELRDVLLPVYEDLSDRKLLERCSKLATQNAKECLNGEMWKRCSKMSGFGRFAIEVLH